MEFVAPCAFPVWVPTILLGTNWHGKKESKPPWNDDKCVFFEYQLSTKLCSAMGKFQSFTLTIDSNATCCYFFFFCAPIWMIGANLCASYMLAVINSSGSIVFINSRVIHCEVQVCRNAVTICESYAERTALCRTNSFNTVYDVQSI